MCFGHNKLLCFQEIDEEEETKGRGTSVVAFFPHHSFDASCSDFFLRIRSIFTRLSDRADAIILFRFKISVGVAPPENSVGWQTKTMHVAVTSLYDML